MVTMQPKSSCVPLTEREELLKKSSCVSLKIVTDRKENRIKVSCSVIRCIQWNMHDCVMW